MLYLFGDIISSNRRTSARISALILGLPSLLARERRHQNRRKPARFQATTVSGLTMTRTLVHACQSWRMGIEHGRRKILPFNGTEHPTGSRIVQQLREAFPNSCPYRYAILDRDARFGAGSSPTRADRCDIIAWCIPDAIAC